MKYLWSLTIEEDSEKFRFERLSEEKLKELSNTPHWILDLSFDYQEDDLSEEEFDCIQKIIKNARFLAKKLELDLSENQLCISQNLNGTCFTWCCGLFEARTEGDDVKLKTSNSWIFRRDQFNAVFDFLEEARKCGWLR